MPRKNRGVREFYKPINMLLHPDLIEKYNRLADLQRISRLDAIRQALEFYAMPQQSVIAHLTALVKQLNTMTAEEYAVLGQESVPQTEIPGYLRGAIMGLGTVLDWAFARLADPATPRSDREDMCRSFQVLLHTWRQFDQRLTTEAEAVSGAGMPPPPPPAREGQAVIAERLDDVATCLHATMDYLKEVGRRLNELTEVVPRDRADLSDACRHIEALEEAVKPMQEQVSHLTEAQKDLAGKLGGLSLTLERRVEFLEDLAPSEPSDDTVKEARQRGRAFLEACEKDVASAMAERLSKGEA